MNPQAGAFQNLLYNLVRRDLAVRYKSTVLGFFWSFIKPLALTTIFFLVFSLVLGMELNESRIPFALHLLAGMLAWNFFAGATGEALGVMLANANLIKKVRLPLVVFPLATVISHLVHFLLGLLVLGALMIALGLTPGGELVFLPLLILLEATLVLALAMILAALNVFYRDVGSIWEVLTTAWFYLTPIIYPVYLALGTIRERWGGGILEWLFLANPLAPIMIGYRRVLLYGGLTEPHLELGDGALLGALGLAALLTGLLLLLGWLIFSRFARSFADEL